MPRKYRGGVAEHRERDVAAHREPADHRLFDVQRIEQVDDVAGVIVDRGRHGVGGRTVEAAQLRDDDAPAMLGELELRLPHPRGQRKAVDQQERAVKLAGATAGSAQRRHIARQRLEVPEPAHYWHVRHAAARSVLTANR